MEDKTKLSIETAKQPSNTESETRSAGKTPAKSITIEDFTILASLGQGSYGEVVWAQKNNNKKQYAIKIIDKLFMKRVTAFPEHSLNLPLRLLGEQRVSSIR